MNKLITLLVLGMVVLLAGCGKTVEGNLIRSATGPDCRVSDEYVYVGKVDTFYDSLKGPSYLSQSTASLRVDAHLYVAEKEGRIEKIAFWEEDYLSSMHKWVDYNAGLFMFMGDLHEKKLHFHDGSGNRAKAFVKHMGEKGYDVYMKEGMLCITLDRTVNYKRKEVYGTCYNTEFIPQHVNKKDGVDEFMERAIREAFTPVE